MTLDSPRTDLAAPVRSSAWLGSVGLERRVGSGENPGAERSGRSLLHLDICSGIGGFAIAAQKAGFRTIAFAEINEYASSVLKRHWPEIPNLGDVRNVGRETIREPVALLTGGFPCQPFSVAGNRLASADERYLWHECVRILRELRPGFGLFENVPGLLTAERGGSFNRVLSDLAALGYDAVWNCIPACAAGKPHERDRVWILVVNPDSVDANGVGSPGGANANPRQWPTKKAQQKRHGWLDELVPTGIAQRGGTYAELVGMVHGIPDWTHRHRALGNAIVPMIAEALLSSVRRAAGAGRGAEKRVNGTAEKLPNARVSD